MVLERFANHCFKCNEDGSSYDLQVDHHMPRHLGYMLTHDNAVVLCAKCNGIKQRSLPQDFYSKGELELLEIMYGVVSHTKRPEEP